MFVSRFRYSVAAMLSLALASFVACDKTPEDVLAEALPVTEQVPGKAVFVTGKITAGDRGDPHFVKAGPYLVIQRRGEIYAWVKQGASAEKQDAGDQTSAGQELRCEAGWTRDPDEDITENDWCRREGNERNLPRRFFLDNDRKADLKITAGDIEYTVTGNPTFIDLPDLDLRKRDMSQPFHYQDGYFYIGRLCAEDTDLGCERVKFLGKKYDREATYTVVGALQGTEIKPLVIDGKEFLFLGAGSIEALIEKADDLK